jgi:hypothetical protein
MEDYMKKRTLALILSLAGVMSLNAATVSVLVVEAGLPPGYGCSSSAEVWESGMMDAFFDAGHIVSNAPCMQILNAAGVLPAEVNGDFDQARIGGADFLVLVVLNYKDGSIESTKDVVIRVFSVVSGDLLYETKIADRVWRSTDEEFFDAKQQAGKLVPQLSRKG